MVTRDVDFVVQYLVENPGVEVTSGNDKIEYKCRVANGNIEQHILLYEGGSKSEDTTRVYSIPEFLEDFLGEEFVFSFKAKKLTKMPDGSFKYDTEKYLGYDDAMFAEWCENSPEHKKEDIEPLAKIVFNKSQYNDAQWATLIDRIYKSFMEILENPGCYCERAMSNLNESTVTSNVEIADLVDLEVTRDEDEVLHWKLRFYDEYDGYNINIRYCPFCGRFLPRKI